MRSYDATQNTIAASLDKRESWLAKVTTIGDPGSPEYWGTKTYTFDGQEYTFKIIPKTFSGPLTNRSKSESGIQAPSTLKFQVTDSADAMTASDYEEATILLKLVVEDGDSNEEIMGAWSFNVKQCTKHYGILHFTCVDFLEKYMEGVWPNTDLVQNIYPSADPISSVIDDNVCVPVPFGTPYIPLRSVMIETDTKRYYVLGPTGKNYDITEVRSPREWPTQSVWSSGSYTFQQVNKGDYRVVQPLVIDGANALFLPGQYFLDMPMKFSREDTAQINGSVTGSHDGGNNSATLDDSSAPFVTSALVGAYIVNRTDGSYGLITANSTTQVTATLEGGTDDDWDSGDNYTIGGPASIIKFVLSNTSEGMGLSSTNHINHTEFGKAEKQFAAWELVWDGAFYHQLPRRKIIAGLLQQCGASLIVGEKLELRIFSGTSIATLTDLNIKKKSFKTTQLTKVLSDYAYVGLVKSGEPQDVVYKFGVPAKASSDEKNNLVFKMPFVLNTEFAQNLTSMALQKKFLKDTNISLVALATLLKLEPNDIITINDSLYGGTTSNVLIDSIQLRHNLDIVIKGTGMSAALDDDFSDFAFSVVVWEDIDTLTDPVQRGIAVGDNTTVTSGDMPNALPGILRVGGTENYIEIDPVVPLITMYEGAQARVEIGKLDTDEYGIAAYKADGTMVMEINTTHAQIAGWDLDTHTLTAASGIVGINSEVTGGLDWRFWAGHATPGSAPFRVDEDGKLYATGATISGVITATSGAIGGWSIDATSIYTGTEDHAAYTQNEGDLTLYASGGNASIHAYNWYIDASGQIVAKAGTIGGWALAATTLTSANIILDQANDRINVGTITIDGTNERIRSDNYAPGVTGAGFTLGPDLLEVGNIAARGIIRTAVFQKDVISAVGGNLFIRPSDVMSVDMAADDAMALTIEGTETFAVGDFLRVKDGASDEWMEVTNDAGAGSGIYVVTRDKAGDYGANANPQWKRGATVVNYGASGKGGIYLTASEPTAPYLSMFTHAGAPWTTITDHVRLGNLDGSYGYVAEIYGIALGAFSEASYITIEGTNGIRFLDAGDVVRAQLNSGTWTLGVTTAEHIEITATAIKLNDGATTYTELAGGTLILGDVANEHVRITGDGVELKDGANIYGTFAATTILGDTGTEHVEITSAHVQFKDGANIYTDLTAGVLKLGLVAGGEYVQIEAAGIAMYGGNTVHLSLSSSGTFWAGDTDATERIQWDTGSGLQIFDKDNVAIAKFPTAAAATIGGWTLSSVAIYTGTEDHAGYATNAGDITIYSSGGNASIHAKNFYIDTSGNVTAQSVTLSGAITATSGAIGGWSIDATSIYTGTEDHVGYTQNAGDITIYSSGADASIHAKNFYIDASGNITATGVTLTGTITATAGNIGGFYIGANDIWGGNAAIGNAATTIIIGGLDGTSKIALGPTADSITIAGTQSGFIADGGGNLRVGDANSFLKWSGGALAIQMASGEAITISAGGDILLEGDNEIGDKAEIIFDTIHHMGATVTGEALGIWTDDSSQGGFVIGGQPYYDGGLFYVIEPYFQIFLHAVDKIELITAGAAGPKQLSYAQDTSGDPSHRFYTDDGFNPDILQFTIEYGKVYTADGTKFGIGTDSPGTRLEIWDSDDPVVTIHNTTQTDSHGGRRTVLQFEGERSGGEEVVQGCFEFSHNSPIDNDNSRFDLLVNNGSGPESVLSITAGTVLIPGLTGNSDVQTNALKQLISTSDKRLKKHLGYLEDGALEKVMQMTPAYYAFKSDLVLFPESKARTLGFYAQDVNLIQPEAAPYDAKEDKWGFNSRAVLAITVKAIQELHDMVGGNMIIADDHETRIIGLEMFAETIAYDRYQSHDVRIATLEKENEELKEMVEMLMAA